MTMEQRCHQFNLDKGIKISRATLLTLYRESKVVRRKASFKFNRVLRTPYQQANEKNIFLRKLLKHIKADK